VLLLLLGFADDDDDDDSVFFFFGKRGFGLITDLLIFWIVG